MPRAKTLMYQQGQDYLAGRIQPSLFDTVLPPAARSELVRPKRPVILEPPRVEQSVKPDRSGILKLAGGVLFAAVILAGVIGHYSQSLKVQHTAPVVQPAPTPAVQPAPAQPESRPLEPPPPAVSAPRARLVLYKRWAGDGVWELTDSTSRTVKLLVDPAPRAQLVRLPEWKIGTSRILSMPYGTEVRGVLKGHFESEAFLPSQGAAIGDTWLVNNVPGFGSRFPERPLRRGWIRDDLLSNNWKENPNGEIYRRWLGTRRRPDVQRAVDSIRG